MKAHLRISVALLCMVAWHNASAQFTNGGEKIFIGDKALLFVGDNVKVKGGEIFNQGKFVVTGDWENNSTTKIFNDKSVGEVIFDAPAMIFTGSGLSNFPNLTFRGHGVYTVKAKVEAALSLNIDDAEIQTIGNRVLTLLNPNANSLTRKGGFINTHYDFDNAFVRYTKANEKYIFPLGSSKLRIKRFVAIAPQDASENIFGVSLVDHDANTDGYSRLLKGNKINNVNGAYYHVLNRISGKSDVNLFFASPQDEQLNSLVKWTTNNSWAFGTSAVVQDNSLTGNDFYRSFLLKAANLPLGINMPFAFAQVSNPDGLEFFNAFSPDGDGKNDTWEIRNIDSFPDNDLKIFDRSGNLIYQAKGYNSSKYWDGQNAISGTYIYILRVNINGTNQNYKGSITIVKN